LILKKKFKNYFNIFLSKKNTLKTTTTTLQILNRGKLVVHAVHKLF
jgi:hypothetical protein